MNAYEKLQTARSQTRPTARSYIEKLFQERTELHGDRKYADDAAIIGGIGMLGDIPATFIGIERGRNLEERIRCNFMPEGYRKALRLMRQAEKFHRPVICFVDTSGAFCGEEAEERGQGQAIADNLMQMMGLETPIITIVIGEGGSGGALALAVADKVWMLQNAVYSVISPEGCASILWKDAAKAETAAANLRLTAEDAKSLGVIERILSENDIGKKEFYDRIRTLLTEEIKKLSGDIDLTQNRYDRFRSLGVSAVMKEKV